MSDTTVPAGGRSIPSYDDRDGPFLPGARVGGRYTIERKIGVGGMGVVYRARQDLTNRSVALKVLRSMRPEGAALDRFLDEIRLLGRLEHHGLAAIHDADLHPRTEGGDVLFFTMELVEGVPVTTWAAQRDLDRGARLSLMARVCDAMQYAHDHGVIHCDLKPANILVRRNGDPVVIDFGLAYLREETAGDGAFESFAAGPGDGRGLAGTPSYMSPEQFQGGVNELRAGQSVDVYALGVVTFELLTGRLPYDLPTKPGFADLRRAVLVTPTRRLAEFLPGIEPELDRAVAKALRKDPAERYFSVAQFLRALSRFLPSATGAPASVWRPAAGLTIPSTNWILDEKLGEGGVGEVWTCHHRTLKNKRIIKFCADEEKASFLRRELTLYKLLKEKIGQNPHFARLEEVALEERPFYMMSEFIEARDFSKWCAAHRLEAPVPEAVLLEIVAQAADALQAAHDAGVIHRDIKPSNLLIRGIPADPSSLHVWVGDFGIGQVVSEDILGDRTRGGFTRTLLGKALSSYSGTHLYLAPELLGGGEASVRSDIYALGVVLYQALAGDFQRVVTIDWASDIPDPLLRADLEKCFARDPAARFPSAAQLADRLRRLPERREKRDHAARDSALREKRAYRRGLARAGAIAAGIIALISGLAWFGFHQSRLANQQTELARRERTIARLGEAKALRRSQTAGKRAAAMAGISPVVADCPPDLRQRFREEAVAILSLADVSGTPVPGLEASDRTWVSPGVTSAASVGADNSVLLRQRGEGGWATLRQLPPLTRPVSKLWVSDAHAVVGALLDDGVSVRLNFGQEWREVAVPSSGCLAVADPGIAAVPSPDGTIEVIQGAAETGGPIVLGRDRSSVLPDAPPSTTSVWPRARPARDAAFDPTGRWLAVGSAESLIVMVWDVRTGQLEAAGEHLHAVSSVAWNPEAPQADDGRGTPESEQLLATGAEDGTATLWDLGRRSGPAGSADHLFMVPTRRMLPPTPRRVAVRQVAFATAGRRLQVLYGDGSLAAFDSRSGDFIDFIKPPRAPTAMAISRDDYLAIQDASQHLTVSSPVLRSVFDETRAFFGQVTDIDSSTEGRLVFARAHEGAALLEPLHLRTLHRFSQAFGNTCRFNPENDFLLAIAGGTFQMWEPVPGGTDPRTMTFSGPVPLDPGDWVDMDMANPREGLRLGVVAREGILRVKRSDDRTETDIPAFTTHSIRRPRFHPSGEWIAAIANGPASPVVAHVETRSVTTLPAAPSQFLDLAFSPDGRFLALRDAAAVQVFAAPSWRLLFRIDDLASRLPTEAPIAFSRDSSLFVLSGNDGVPILYRVPGTGAEAWPVATRLETPRVRDATSARFGGPGGCHLLIGTADGYLQSWNIADLRRSLRRLGLDWDGPEWNWPERLVPCEKVVVTPPQ